MWRKIGEFVKLYFVYKEEDMVVFWFELLKLLCKVKELLVWYGFIFVCYGYVGDGNLYVNIIKGSMSDEKWNKDFLLVIWEFFVEVVKLGGIIFGEYGIGLV